MDIMVERVARLLCKQEGVERWDEFSASGYEENARQVIAEMREPTKSMCRAGYYDATHSIESVGSLCDLTPEDQPRSIWQAMIDEALKSAKPSAKP